MLATALGLGRAEEAQGATIHKDTRLLLRSGLMVDRAAIFPTVLTRKNEESTQSYGCLPTDDTCFISTSAHTHLPSGNDKLKPRRDATAHTRLGEEREKQALADASAGDSKEPPLTWLLTTRRHLLPLGTTARHTRGPKVLLQALTVPSRLPRACCSVVHMSTALILGFKAGRLTGLAEQGSPFQQGCVRHSVSICGIPSSHSLLSNF